MVIFLDFLYSIIVAFHEASNETEKGKTNKTQKASTFLNSYGLYLPHYLFGIVI